MTSILLFGVLEGTLEVHITVRVLNGALSLNRGLALIGLIELDLMKDVSDPLRSVVVLRNLLLVAIRFRHCTLFVNITAVAWVEVPTRRRLLEFFFLRGSS